MFCDATLSDLLPAQVAKVGPKAPAAGNATSHPVATPVSSGNGVAGLSAAVAAGIAINIRQIQVIATYCCCGDTAALVPVPVADSVRFKCFSVTVRLGGL